MARRIPASVHGLLDCLSAVLLYSLPRMMAWSVLITNLLTTLALMTMVYSLTTRCHLRLNRALPVSPPLAVSFLFGLLLAVTPFLFLQDPPQFTRSLTGFGCVEIAFFLLTRRPAAARQAALPV